MQPWARPGPGSRRQHKRRQHGSPQPPSGRTRTSASVGLSVPVASAEQGSMHTSRTLGSFHEHSSLAVCSHEIQARCSHHKLHPPCRTERHGVTCSCRFVEAQSTASQHCCDCSTRPQLVFRPATLHAGAEAVPAQKAYAGLFGCGSHSHHLGCMSSS